jgi:hypothetical protein
MQQPSALGDAAIQLSVGQTLTACGVDASPCLRPDLRLIGDGIAFK